MRGFRWPSRVDNSALSLAGHTVSGHEPPLALEPKAGQGVFGPCAIMFESLQNGLTSALKTLQGKARLTEANMRDGLTLVEQSLLEADVSYSRRQGLHRPRLASRRSGEKVLLALDPTQQLVGIVYQELVDDPGPGRSVDSASQGRDRPDDVRPAGLGQDDHLRQARPAARSRARSSRCSSRPTCSAPRPSTSCT